MEDYKIVSPPFTLEFREMTKKELKAYYEWFMSVMPGRIEMLIETVRSTSTFQEWIPDYSPDSLQDLGRWFVLNVQTRKRTAEDKERIYGRAPKWFQNIEVSDYELTNRTFSLAIDIGMYMSQVFLKNNPSLKWRHCMQQTIDYGQPVIAGFGKLDFNPVQMIVTHAYAIARRTRNADGLRELYNIWTKLIR